MDDSAILNDPHSVDTSDLLTLDQTDSAEQIFISISGLIGMLWIHGGIDELHML